MRNAPCENALDVMSAMLLLDGVVLQRKEGSQNIKCRVANLRQPQRKFNL